MYAVVKSHESINSHITMNNKEKQKWKLNLRAVHSQKDYIT